MPRSSYKQKSTPRPDAKQRSHQGAGELRIIGGLLRGRKLAIADVPGLRPTTDRVRETLFNWLQFELTDSRCLDLFAGSGALAFEALSRGAMQVILVEKDAQAANLLAQHAAKLSEAVNGQALVQRGDALQFLQQQPDASFNVIFIDPPFGLGLADDCLTLIAQNNWVSSGSWVYVETEKAIQPHVPATWQLHREKFAGQVAFRLYHVN
jgi:16S rRNA m(2)G-966 methyltransferase (EC 2.1.1.52)